MTGTESEELVGTQAASGTDEEETANKSGEQSLGATTGQGVSTQLGWWTELSASLQTAMGSSMTSGFRPVPRRLTALGQGIPRHHPVT